MSESIIRLLKVIKITHRDRERQIVDTVIDIILNGLDKLVICNLILNTRKSVAPSKLSLIIKRSQMLLLFTHYLIDILDTDDKVLRIAALSNRNPCMLRLVFDHHTVIDFKMPVNFERTQKMISCKHT